MICTRRYRSETDKWTDSSLSPYLTCGRARDNGIVQRSLISASRRKSFLSCEARSISLFFSGSPDWFKSRRFKPSTRTENLVRQMITADHPGTRKIGRWTHTDTDSRAEERRQRRNDESDFLEFEEAMKISTCYLAQSRPLFQSEHLFSRMRSKNGISAVSSMIENEYRFSSS